MTQKIVIFGNNNIAEMIYYDNLKAVSGFDITAFAVDDVFLNGDSLRIRHYFCG